jgi:hypothetical protein
MYRFDSSPARSAGWVAAVVLGLCPLAKATTIRISQGNASFTYNDRFTDRDSFIYGDSANTLYQESWYLVTSTGDALELRNGSRSESGNSGTMTYTSGLIGGVTSVAINYTIVDTGSAGILSASATVITSSSTADVSLINYFDYDLGNSPNNESATYNPSTGTMTIMDGGSDLEVVRRGVMADAWQMGNYATLRTQITNGTRLTSNSTSFGPGDFTGAMQWNIAPTPGVPQVFNSGGGGGAIGVPEIGQCLPVGALLMGGLLRRTRRRSA